MYPAFASRFLPDWSKNPASLFGFSAAPAASTKTPALRSRLTVPASADIHFPHRNCYYYTPNPKKGNGYERSLWHTDKKRRTFWAPPTSSRRHTGAASGSLPGAAPVPSAGPGGANGILLCLRADVIERIDTHPVAPHFKMEVRAGGIAGGTDQTDGLSLRHRLPVDHHD